MRWTALVALGLVAGCLRSSTVTCEDGRVCPADRVCDLAHQKCVLQEQFDACEIDAAIPGHCQAPGIEDGFCHDGVCFPIACGNGLVDDGEACDDGNTDNDLTCAADCRSDVTCGNGIVDLVTQEQCDDGNRLQHDGCSGSCKREVPTWREETPGGLSYNAYGSVPLAADPRRGALVMIGIEDNLTWEWSGSQWVALHPRPTPPRRSDAALVFDGKGVLLFGGGGSGASSVLRDTWRWDGFVWTLMAPPVAPPGRGATAMAYASARNRVVMFGGGNAQAAALGDTWEWNPDDETWTEIVTGSSPVKRYAHAMAYDPVRDRVVVFGGVGPGGDLDDTWEFDGASWTEKLPAHKPSARHGMATAFDPISGRVLAFSGFTPAHLADLWAWDGNDWEELPVADPPTSRSGAGFAFDGQRNQMVLFGGADFVGYSDTWAWDGNAWSPLSNGQAPARRPGAAVSYNPQTGEIVQFGGLDESVPAMTDVTWEWAGNGWKGAAIQPSPAPRGYAGIAYDIARDQTVLIGGEDAAGAGLDDVWTYSAGVWTPSGTLPAPTTRAAVVYDEVNRRVTMFGGADGAGGVCGASTLAWDGAWTDVTPASSPSARCRAAATYDRYHEKFLLWGGTQQSPPTARDDTWEWDGAAWVERPGTVGPSARDHAALIADPAFRGDVLFGGTVMFGGEMERDTWAWDGDVWTIPVPVEAPPPCQGAAVYDAVHGQTVLLGCGAAPTSEVWTFRWQAGGEHEACRYGFDTDGDQAIGCDDPDCWGVCRPMCPPGLECPTDYPRCGDGTCGPLEGCRYCPADCGDCQPLCGDYLCDPGESESSCPGDC